MFIAPGLQITPHLYDDGNMYFKIGCKTFEIEDFQDFFSWYFSSKHKYRFLLWANGKEPINIYRYGDSSSIKIYEGDHHIVKEENIFEAYVWFSEEKKLYD